MVLLSSVRPTILKLILTFQALTESLIQDKKTLLSRISNSTTLTLMMPLPLVLALIVSMMQLQIKEPEQLPSLTCTLTQTLYQEESDMKHHIRLYSLILMVP
jgi:hypothetical protein